MPFKKLAIFFIIFIVIISLSRKNNMKAKIISEKNSTSVSLFLCGDVMTGRGIDQILPYPSNPVIFEAYMKDARGYVEIAESINGQFLFRISGAIRWLYWTNFSLMQE